MSNIITPLCKSGKQEKTIGVFENPRLVKFQSI
jgi:hypothetical protein